jgi:membrane protease YdiL (CAAX protease family)
MWHSDVRHPQPRVLSKAFFNRGGQLRNGWWVAIFLAILTALLVPVLLVSAHANHDISMWEQLALVGIATIAVQALRRKPVSEVIGPIGLRSLNGLGAGLCWGFLLMIVPAGVLWFAGYVHFDRAGASLSSIAAAAGLMAAVALAEELLFRGVLFQRLTAAIGFWPAQVGVGLLFVLTHLGNPGMEGTTLLLAGTNIFLASIVFGLSFRRAGGLAMPVGLHFMANVTQGVLLGFGVSGNSEASLLSPRLVSGVDWLTGGSFGLEASVPGLITLIALLGWFCVSDRGQDVGGRGYKPLDPERINP